MMLLALAAAVGFAGGVWLIVSAIWPPRPSLAPGVDPAAHAGQPAGDVRADDGVDELAGGAGRADAAAPGAGHDAGRRTARRATSPSSPARSRCTPARAHCAPCAGSPRAR